MARVVVVGSANMDLVVRTSHIPAPGETVLGGEFLIAPGGKGANQAVAAARLGSQVTFVGCVGQDAFGESLLSGLIQEGIDTTHVTVHPGAPSGVALILVDDDGQNSIAVAPGANAHLTPALVSRAKPAIEEADVLLLQLEIPVAAVTLAAQMGRHAGASVILNPAPAPSEPLSPTLLDCVDILTPNQTEASSLAVGAAANGSDVGAAAKAMLGMGVGAVVVTLGEQGALLATSKGLHRIPAPSVDVVDTTAAGDAFNGAVATALGNGRSLVDAVRYANVCGALATTKMGAQPSLPKAVEVERMIERSIPSPLGSRASACTGSEG